MAVLNVAAIIVTRGDVDLNPIFDSLPTDWERIFWVNRNDPSGPFLSRYDAGTMAGARWPGYDFSTAVQDLSVYGRYAAIEYATGDLIYVQDDDCVVSDPQAIVDAWQEYRLTQFDYQRSEDGEQKVLAEWANEHVVCNMPPEFRHEFYTEHALVGFGSCFHRDAPARAFQRFWEPQIPDPTNHIAHLFNRTCDIVFTALTPRVLVDVPVKNLWWAEDETRMYRQESHVAERTRMLELVKQVRDA